MKKGTPDHPKVKALARRLRINRAWAVGILEMLWHFTAQYAPAGDIGRFADDEIAEACAWPQDRPEEELIEALIACRLLDEHPQHRLVVHDWHEHADDSVHYRLAKVGARFANGKIPDLRVLHSRDRRAATQRYRPDGSVVMEVPGNSAGISSEPSGNFQEAQRELPGTAGECHSHSHSHSHSQCHSQTPKPSARARAWGGEGGDSDAISPERIEISPGLSFSMFQAEAIEAGMDGSETDWVEAEAAWRTLSFEQQLAAVDGIKSRAFAARDDPALKALPQNYLRRRMWQRKIRAASESNFDKARDIFFGAKKR